jgi:hypothetical protein
LWGFLRGGFLFAAAVLTFLLLLLPLGMEVRVTPFGLAVLFFVGGCGGMIGRSIRVRPKVRVRRSL